MKRYRLAIIFLSSLMVVLFSHVVFAGSSDFFNKNNLIKTASLVLSVNSNQVYQENKDNFIKSYKFISMYQRYNDEKAFDNAQEAKEMIELGKMTLDVLDKGIPEGFIEFQKNNPDAKKISFEAKTRYLRADLVTSEAKLLSAKTTFIKKIEKRIGWIERSNNAEKADKYFNEMTELFDQLEKSYPNDEDVLAAKDKLIAEAQAKAGSLLEQHKAKLASYTMPKDDKNVKDLKVAKENIVEIFKGIFHIEPLRVTVPYNWEKRDEYVRVDDKIIHRDFYATKGAVAYHDKKSNKFFVKEILIKKVGSQIDFLAYGDKNEILESKIGM